ncbi:MAG: T9SS C-terminal target domain-containing protein, partial [Calditrichaeota bacterium]
YIYTEVSICRNTTVSTAVIHGVLPGESAKLSTLWAILGQPAGSIAVPYWPVGATPAAANGTSTAPLCDYAKLIRAQLFDQPAYENYIDTYKLLDGLGSGIWKNSFPAEDSIFTATDSILPVWRSDSLNIPSMLAHEAACADYALAKLQNIYANLITTIAENEQQLPAKIRLHQNYPNPFNASTKLEFRIPEPAFVTLKIYNTAGEEVATLLSSSIPSGAHSVTVDASGLASGIYFYKLQVGNYTQTRKMMLIR